MDKTRYVKGKTFTYFTEKQYNAIGREKSGWVEELLPGEVPQDVIEFIPPNKQKDESAQQEYFEGVRNNPKYVGKITTRQTKKIRDIKRSGRKSKDS